MVTTCAASSWLVHLKTYVDLDTPASQQISSRNAITTLIGQKAMTLSQLISEMGAILTSTNDALRARGILLLGELWLDLQEQIQENNVIHQFATFFAARLEDWHSLHGALLGSLALLKRRKDVGSISDEDAKALLETALENLQVQTLAQQNRLVCLELFECFIIHHSEAVIYHGAKFSEALCDMIDGEKDPRCLLIGFRVIELAAPIFPDREGHIGRVSEELFGILSCYFPISFTPAPDDKRGITREDLSMALMHCFGSTTLFADFCIPFLLEKLSSTLKSAKLDSLKFLGYCASQYGGKELQKHSAAIWISLKQELLSSHRTVEVGLTEADETVLKEALVCLEACLKSVHAGNEKEADFLEKDNLLQLIMQDDFLDDFFNCARSYFRFPEHTVANSGGLEYPPANTGVFERALATVKEAGCVLGVAIKASPGSCSAVSQVLFSNLIDILRPGIGIEEADVSNFFKSVPVKKSLWFPSAVMISVLEVLSSLVQCIREISEGFCEMQNVSLADIKWIGPLQSYSQNILQAFVAMIVSGLQNRMVIEPLLIEKLWKTGVTGLQAVGSFPAQVSALSKDQYEFLMAFLKSVILEKSEVTLLWNEVVQTIGVILTVEETYLECRLSCKPLDAFISLLMRELHENKQSSLPVQCNLRVLSVLCNGRPFTLTSVVKQLSGVVCKELKEGLSLADGKDEPFRRIVPLLQGLLDFILPCCESTHVEAEVMLELAGGIWNVVENLPDSAFCNDSAENIRILEWCLEIVRSSVSQCIDYSQRHLLVQILNPFLAASSYFSECVRARDVWIIGFFASTITALWPTVHIPEKDEVLCRLLAAAVSLSSRAINVVASEAVCSLLNKWHTNGNKVRAVSGIDSAISEATDLIMKSEWLSPTLLRQTTSSCRPVAEDSLLLKKNCIKLLAFSGKGLAMRGHIAVSDIAMLLLNLVLCKKSLLGAHPANLLDVLWPSDEEKLAVSSDAAEALGFIAKDTKSSACKKNHLLVKPLYQQRFFLSMLPPLLLLLKETDEQERLMLHYAFGQLISGVPINVVLTETNRVFPLMLESISALSDIERHSGVLLSVLLVLSAMLVDKHGVEVASHQVPAIIGRLLNLINHKYSVMVRETSLLCLGALVALPYMRVFPFRTRVLKSLTKALDDPKRVVRKEAIKCRRAWESLSQ